MKGTRWTAIFLVTMFLLVFPTVTFAGKNDLVNMNVVNGNVRDVLSSLGRIGHTSMVIDDQVQGNITINLRYVPFEDALDIIAQVKGLSYDRVGNVIVIVKHSGSDDKNKSQTDLGRIHIIKLKHVKAEDIIDKVALQLGDKIDANDEKRKSAINTNVDNKNKQTDQTNSNVGKMTVSKMTQDNVVPDYEHVKIDGISNSLVLKCTESDFIKTQKLVEQLDVYYPEVLLEAKIVSITKNGQDKLGVDWSWAAPTGSVAGQYTIDGGATKTIKFGRDSAHSVDSKIALNALFQTDDAKLLAKPQILAINGRPAFIHVGDSLPLVNVSVDSNGTTQYTVNDYIDDGIILTYIPVINSDGTITATLKTEVSLATQVDANKLQYIYQLSRKRAETEVVMKDGETIVIGGLINKQELKTVNKIPLLGDLPILGGFFKNMTSQSDNAEVVIFLTAHLVKDKLNTEVNKNNELAAAKKTTDLLGGELRD